MTNSDTVGLNRRNFLRGAVALAGAAVLNLDSAASAGASAPGDSPPAATSLSLWTGQFANPSAVTAGAGLTGGQAKISVHNHFVPGNANSLFDVILAHYAIQGDGGLTDAPVYVWCANPSSKDITFKMPTKVVNGITISVQLSDGAGTEDFFFLSTQPGGQSPKLRTGTYVLAAGSPAWANYRLVNNAVLNNSKAPADFEYVLLTVGAA